MFDSFLNFLNETFNWFYIGSVLLLGRVVFYLGLEKVRWARDNRNWIVFIVGTILAVIFIYNFSGYKDGDDFIEYGIRLLFIDFSTALLMYTYFAKYLFDFIELGLEYVKVFLKSKIDEKRGNYIRNSNIPNVPESIHEDPFNGGV